MKSIKPGRGPSMMGGIAGIAAALFGVFWILFAMGIGAGIMAPFGVIFIVIALVQAAYNFHNATGENRFSEFDITEDGEEPDPLEPRQEEKAFCPFCGQRVKAEYEFCPGCGRRLEKNRDGETPAG